MDQAGLFYDSYLDALRDDVLALGGPKVVGKMLFPEKELEPARNALNDCLNSTRRERLSDEQERLIIRKAREARGFSAALYFLCDDAGFERPKAINPEDEKAKLMREFNEGVKRLGDIAQRLEIHHQSPITDHGSRLREVAK